MISSLSRIDDGPDAPGTFFRIKDHGAGAVALQTTRAHVINLKGSRALHGIASTHDDRWPLRIAHRIRQDRRAGS